MSELINKQESITDTDTDTGLGFYWAHPTKDILDLRSRFMKAMGWRKDDDDRDFYDGSERTAHFVKYNSENKLATSMRLTEVESVDNCLSHLMTRGCPEMYAQVKSRAAEIDEAAVGGGVWDLTRLVHPMDGSVSPHDIVEGITDMIGLAIAKTSNGEVGENPNLTWVYTTTPQMKRTLDGLGIVGEVIAEGRISPGDEDISYFCMIKPYEALAYAYEHPGLALRGALRGLEAANRL